MNANTETSIALNNVDFLINLDCHGWSDIYWFVDHKLIRTDAITHIFSNPHDDFLDVCFDLLNKQDAELYLFHEPGATKITFEMIKPHQHFIKITIYDVLDEIYQPTNDARLQEVALFTMAKQHFLIIAHMQYKKIMHLLADHLYAENRNKDFPYVKFKEFEKMMGNGN